MAFTIEFSTASERDLSLIFDHLFDSYTGFGESAQTAYTYAARRVAAIRKATDTLATFPVRGTRRDDIFPGARYLAIDRAIYWFEIDERTKKVRVLAVFFGGQDHIRHMLLRLLQK